jgi:hypothetical protein
MNKIYLKAILDILIDVSDGALDTFGVARKGKAKRSFARGMNICTINNMGSPDGAEESMAITVATATVSEKEEPKSRRTC